MDLFTQNFLFLATSIELLIKLIIAMMIQK